MADDGLRERGNSLEEEFFQKQNAALVERLRSTQAQEAIRSQMMVVSGVEDAALIDQLVEHGVTPASFAALAIAPLVAVAWADRRLEAKEKAAVLQEAAASGLQAGSAEYALLEEWLTAQPPDSLMAAWGSYAREVSATLTVGQRRGFRDAILARANAVANAAGGFGGRGTTSPEEKRVLDAIESALAG